MTGEGAETVVQPAVASPAWGRDAPDPGCGPDARAPAGFHDRFPAAGGRGEDAPGPECGRDTRAPGARAPDYKAGFAWNLLFNTITKIATPVIAIVVARRLGPEIMGMYMILVTLMTFADLFRDAGISRVFLNEQNPAGATERGYTAISILLGLVLAAGLGATSVPIASLYHAPVLVGGLFFGAGAILLNSFSTIPQAKLLKQTRFKEVAFAESAGSVLSSLYALVLVLAGAGFLALASQLVVRSVIFLMLVQRLAPCRIGRGEAGLFRRIAGASGILTAINFLWVTFSVGDQALIAKLAGLSAGGLYGTGKMIVTTADVIAKPLTQTATVAFSNHQAEAGRTLHKSLSIFLVAILPIYVGVAFLAEPLVLTLLGPKFAGTVRLLPALCVYGAAIYIGSFAGNAMLAAGRPQVALYGWLGLYAALGAFFLVTPERDPLVLAWVFAIGLAAVNSVTLAAALRRFGGGAGRGEDAPSPGSGGDARAPWRAIAPVLITTLALALLATMSLSHPVKLMLACTAIPAIYLGLLGTFFLRHPARMFSSAGVHELWRAL